MRIILSPCWRACGRRSSRNGPKRVQTHGRPCLSLSAKTLRLRESSMSGWQRTGPPPAFLPRRLRASETETAGSTRFASIQRSFTRRTPEKPAATKSAGCGSPWTPSERSRGRRTGRAGLCIRKTSRNWPGSCAGLSIRLDATCVASSALEC